MSSAYSYGSLSRASSEASLDELHHTPAKALFRKYVDKTLKRMGMNKMLLRFKELLDRTLQRAREALQRPKSLTQLEMQVTECFCYYGMKLLMWLASHNHFIDSLNLLKRRGNKLINIVSN